MSHTKIKVSNITITDLSPKIADPELVKLLPKTLFPKRISFEIEGASNAVANGIRRTVMGELLIVAMTFSEENFITDNPFSINSMILNRFRLIPIDQKTPIDAVFELDVQNKTDRVIDIYSSQIHIVNAGTKLADGTKAAALKKLPFNETIPLFTLEPGRWLKIHNITVKQDFGFNFAGHSIASNAVSLPLDQKPINLYLPETDPDRGTPSRMSNPRHYRIEFNTTGGMDSRELMVYTCNNLISRMQILLELLDSIESNNDVYVWIINGESSTVGNLLMRTTLDLFPDKTITFSEDSVMRRVTIRLRCDEDISSIMTTVIKHNIAIYTDIRKSFV